MGNNCTESVHLYLVPEWRRNVSAVPGGREQVRLQCISEGIVNSDVHKS